MRHLLKNLDDYSEGKTMQNSILLFKDLKCSTNKNIVLLFERPKPTRRPNTIILVKVMAVTSDRHSEHEFVQY